ncbi:MAG TPA: flavodoxin domain-containing protein [Stellaceae bacterium]|jgi:MioC protein|nr:flavodoxin domain-containing protein [Stellaceae bacterium]
MTEPITILVGTMTGTAELVADEVKDTLAAEGLAAEVLAMDKLTPAAFERPGRFLVCTSTYGQGDVPDNARDFFAALETARPDLARVEYGVIALGDHTYAQTFCFGGKRFDRLLASLGAKRLGEILLHDASAGTVPEEVAVEWVRRWAGEFLQGRSEAA